MPDWVSHHSMQAPESMNSRGINGLLISDPMHSQLPRLRRHEMEASSSSAEHVVYGAIDCVATDTGMQ